MPRILPIFLFAASSIIASSILAQDKKFDSPKTTEFLVQIKNHRFEPSEITTQPNQKFTLIIENLDSTLEEFESDDLKKEKLVGAGKKISLPINALKAGEYKFYGDFHQKTAQGKIIVK